MQACVVPTVIGDIGVGWSERGLVRVQLPARDVAAMLKREGFALVDRAGGEPSAWIARIVSHLDGASDPFDGLPLDSASWSPFSKKVYDAARAIPPGETRSYGEVAASIGSKAPRAVGVALGKNPLAIVVPCHRVTGTNDCGGFSAMGGATTKATLLAIEGGALGDPEHRAARAHLRKVDPKLAPYVKRVACMLPVKPKGALFRTLARAIAGQQLSTKAGATIFGRLQNLLFGDASSTFVWPREAPKKLLSFSDEALRAVGLSGAKTASLKDLSRRVDDGLLDLERITRAPDEVVIEKLSAVRGIGRWTAEMLLMFDFGRPDVLPVADLGIRKGVQKVYGLRDLPDEDRVRKLAEPWRPWRSIGSWYLWRSLESE